MFVHGHAFAQQEVDRGVVDVCSPIDLGQQIGGELATPNSLDDEDVE